MSKAPLPVPVDPANVVAARLTLDSKSILARLMAMENLIVEHQPGADTATFDTNARKLTLPVWTNIDEDLYDMLVGHEVGHALFTPAGMSPLEKAINFIDKDNPQLVKGYLNIVEDARIEKAMKQKYPGLVHNFRRAYTAMYQRDMFGLKERVTSGKPIPLIDKLNIKAKVGVHADVDMELNILETALFMRMMNTQSWDDVIRVTKDIYDQASHPPEQQPPTTPGTPTGGGGAGGSKGGNGSKGGKPAGKDVADAFDKADDMLSDDATPERGGQDVPDAAPEKDDSAAKDEGDGEDAPNICNETVISPTKPEPAKADEKAPAKVKPEASITDQHYTKMIQKLDKANSGGVDYFDVPKTINGCKRIEHWQKFLDRMSAENYDQAILDGLYNDFKAESNNYVNMLVKEFELKKAADLHTRSSLARTGAINCNRLHSYKFSEDIFKRVANIKAGKSHGMIMVIDWSGSMNGCLNSTVKQLLNLVMFCRKTNIPFDVYCFSDRITYDKKGNPENSIYSEPHTGGPNDIVMGNVRLVNFISSDMPTEKLTRAMKYLLALGNHYLGGCDPVTGVSYRKILRIPGTYETGGTPLNAAILCAFDLIPEFRKRTGVQIVNFTILTDGEDSMGLYSHGGTRGGYYATNTVVRDAVTRTQVCYNNRDGRMSNVTIALLKLLKHRTKCNTVGFYLLPSRHGKSTLAGLLHIGDLNQPENQAKIEAEVTHFRTKKFVESKTWGYDSYFIIPSDELDTRLAEKDEFVNKNFTPGRIAGGFIKSMQAKKVNRVVLGRFIDIIAKEPVEVNLRSQV